MRRSYVDGRWGQIHIRSAGISTDAPPLLLLHPTPKSGWIFETLAPLLAKDRLVVAPDTPGYGASDAPPAPASIEDLAMALLDAAGAVAGQGPVDVLGYHTGSVLAVAMAALAPQRVRRLTLVSLPAYDAASRTSKLKGLATWPRPQIDGAHLTRLWEIMRGRANPAVNADWLHASFAENLRPGARGPWGYEAVYRYDLIAALSALTHPTLVLNPEDDLWEVTAAHASLIGGAAYVELPGAGHGVFTLQADVIAKAVTRFLA